MIENRATYKEAKSRTETVDLSIASSSKISLYQVCLVKKNNAKP